MAGTTTLAPETVDEWFLCGPIELTTLVRETLIEHGVDPEHIHLELFFGYDTTRETPRARLPRVDASRSRCQAAEQTVELDPGDSILEAALQARPDAPYACMGGACGTCRAKLLDGTVEMDHNFALSQADLDAGYVLTCQSHPTSDAVTIDYDE